MPVAEEMPAEARSAPGKGARDPLAAALESVSDPLFFLDRDWRYVYANRAAVAASQRDVKDLPDDLTGLDIWSAAPYLVGSEFQRGLVRAMETGTPQHFEFVGHKTHLWHEVNAYPCAEGVAVCLRDVSERHSREETIRELSVPVLEIGPRLLLVPLIGPMDAQRAALFTDRVLHTIRDLRARVVVIDVTGLYSVDARLAESLINAARCALLLGARPTSPVSPRQ